eukprot:PhM_4_TR16091/c1_g1_i1/m.90105
MTSPTHEDLLERIDDLGVQLHQYESTISGLSSERRGLKTLVEHLQAEREALLSSQNNNFKSDVADSAISSKAAATAMRRRHRCDDDDNEINIFGDSSSDLTSASQQQQLMLQRRNNELEKRLAELDSDVSATRRRDDDADERLMELQELLRRQEALIDSQKRALRREERARLELQDEVAGLKTVLNNNSFPSSSRGDNDDDEGGGDGDDLLRGDMPVSVKCVGTKQESACSGAAAPETSKTTYASRTSSKDPAAFKQLIREARKLAAAQPEEEKKKAVEDEAKPAAAEQAELPSEQKQTKIKHKNKHRRDDDNVRNKRKSSHDISAGFEVADPTKVNTARKEVDVSSKHGGAMARPVDTTANCNVIQQCSIS